jgi:Thoeris protein ThsB, TIR-like domain
VSASQKHRIFISFAIEDKSQRDLLIGQARNKKSPFRFVDMSVKKPWDKQWKTRCRTKMKGCDGVIALISRNTAKAAGAKWEMKCAIEDHIPIMGLYAYSDDRSAAPAEFGGNRVMTWTWDNISSFLKRLENIDAPRNSDTFPRYNHTSQPDQSAIAYIVGAIGLGAFVILACRKR